MATGAIGIGMLVAEYMNLPFVYVRPEPKGHGRKNQVEGVLHKGQSVVVIEDLISTGSSSLNAVKALQEEKVTIKGMLAIFTYGFKTSEDNFKKAKINLYTLSNYDQLIETALKTHYINGSEAEILKSWRQDPSKWEAK